MNKEMPLVSIVVPCYNHEVYIKDCIQSIIQQTYENIELIIIDDGSSDTSFSKIKELNDLCKERFTRFELRSRPNKGLSATLNEAIDWCEGEYYCVIASDDQMLAHKTTIQVDFLEKNNNYVAVFGGVINIDQHSNMLSIVSPKQKAYNHRDIMLHQHNLPAPSQLIRLKALKKTGGYIPGLVIEDWYMWLTLSRDNDLYLLDTIVCKYRKHHSNTSNNLALMQEERINVLKHFKDSKYYSEAIKQAKWVSSLEYFMFKKNIYNFMRLLVISPTITIKRGAKYLIK